MNTTELINVLHKKKGYKKTEVNKFIDDFLEVTLEALKYDDTLKLKDFGAFRRSRRKGRYGTNPKTCEKIYIPEKNTIIFTPYKKIKQEINN